MRNTRKNLWLKLSSLILSNEACWILARNFKSPLYPSEKCGGLIDYTDSMEDLANFLNVVGIIDFDLQG